LGSGSKFPAKFGCPPGLTADLRGDAVPEAKVTRLKDKLAKLKQEATRLTAINEEMMQSEDKQVSLTDPDARSMATSGQDTGIVGYNVQMAVETKNHIIVAHEVTNVSTDYHHLLNMGEQARTAMGVETLEAVADRGYHEGYEILACEEAGITVTVPRRLTSTAKAEVALVSKTLSMSQTKVTSVQDQKARIGNRRMAAGFQ
jgi:hypothetical protein